MTLGFSVLATSSFLINAQMGLLTALAIVVALLFDFTLLPALLMIGYKKENRNMKDSHHNRISLALLVTERFIVRHFQCLDEQLAYALLPCFVL